MHGRDLVGGNPTRYRNASSARPARAARQLNHDKL
jgi:hypothetical protein